MKRRFLWLALAVAAGLALGTWLNRPAPPAAAPIARPAPVKPPAEPVAIEDHKTIDFSGGRAVVKDDPKSRAIIDAAVKEMDEAMKHVRFEPPASLATEKKPAEPAPPPKN